MSPPLPRIGVTPGYRTKDVRQGISRIDLATNYTDAVTRAGGLPIVLVPNTEDGRAEACAHSIDGLLLTGGPDLDPARYGQELHPESKPLAAERDAFDFALLRAVLDAGKPVLGLCLGHQQINVALGGSLHQHLPDVVPLSEIEHRWLNRDTQPLPRHDVEVDPDSRLAGVLGATSLLTNSSHHQAVDELAPGLRRTAATADGVLEGLESQDSDQILAVQWHPEYLTDELPHLALFEDLVTRARRAAG
jgi:putative glutamine amidotransferase